MGEVLYFASERIPLGCLEQCMTCNRERDAVDFIASSISLYSYIVIVDNCEYFKLVVYQGLHLKLPDFSCLNTDNCQPWHGSFRYAFEQSRALFTVYARSPNALIVALSPGAFHDSSTSSNSWP